MTEKRHRSKTPGHIRAHGKGWQVIVTGIDPDTGAKKQIYRTVHGDRDEAEGIRAEMLADVRRGQLHADPSATLTVTDALDAWLEHAEPDLAATTAYNYRRLIDNRIGPKLGNRDLRQLRAADLDRFYSGLRKELAPKTVRNIHALLRRAFAQAERWGWITSNPASLASPPKATRPDIRPPSREDVQGFLPWALAADPPLGTLLRLAAVTGARRGELAGLKWSDLDADTLLIERAVAQIGGARIMKGTKTYQARRLALDAETVGLLRRQRTRVRWWCRTSEKVTFSDGLPMFPNPVTLGHQHPDTISKHYRALADKYGLPGRLHDFRHFAATQALAAGIPVRTVAGRLGHANASTTHNTYAHFVEVSDQAAAAVLGALLDKESG